VPGSAAAMKKSASISACEYLKSKLFSTQKRIKERICIKDGPEAAQY
jgi:hypothetical protein